MYGVKMLRYLKIVFILKQNIWRKLWWKYFKTFSQNTVLEIKKLYFVCKYLKAPDENYFDPQKFTNKLSDLHTSTRRFQTNDSIIVVFCGKL